MKSWEILRQCAEYSSDLLEQIPADAIAVFQQAMGRWIMDGAYGLWLEPDTRDGHADPEALAIELGCRISALADLYSGGGMNSPIEHRMAAALLWLQKDWAGFPSVDLLGHGPRKLIIESGPFEHLHFGITPQFKVGKYKADFLLWFALKRFHAGVIVECDGHAFHERTKEQAAHDKKRDRDLLTAGYPVLRFTGSEIFKDVLGCADQVRDALSEPLHRVSRDGGLY